MSHAAYLVLVIALFSLQLENAFSASEVNDDALSSISLNDPFRPELPALILNHGLARELCQEVANHQASFPHRHQFLWVKIQKTDKKPTTMGNPPKSENTNNNQWTTIKPGCQQYVWKSCVGKPRFPLLSNCGFFDVISLPSDECAPEQGKEKETTVQKSLTGENLGSATSLDHSRAIQLCEGVKGVSEDPKKRILFKFVPLSIENVEEPSSNPDYKTRLDCVVWEFQPCPSDTEVVKTSTCNKWSRLIKQDPTCQRLYGTTSFSARRLNVKNDQVLKSQSAAAIHFMQEDTEKPQQDSTTPVMPRFIECSREGDQTTCTIPRTPRTKRDLSTAMMMSLRQWCCWYGECRAALDGHHGSRRYGHYHPGRQWDCPP